METFDTKQMVFELQRDEGFRQFPYADTNGNLTIGYGRNLTSNGIDSSEAVDLLMNDIDTVCVELNANWPWWTDLSETRQRVMVNMCFNLGSNGLKTFVKFLDAMRNSDWQTAASEMMASQWASQVGDRATRLRDMVLEG